MDVQLLPGGQSEFYMLNLSTAEGGKKQGYKYFLQKTKFECNLKCVGTINL